MSKVTIDNYPVKFEYPVHWGDMDAARHVNNLVYLRWSESARIGFFEAIGIKPNFSGDAVGPILAWQDCKYILPITFPDNVIVGCKVNKVLPDRFELECATHSVQHNRIAAISKQLIVPYDYGALQKADLPDAWLEGISKLKLAG